MSKQTILEEIDKKNFINNERSRVIKSMIYNRYGVPTNWDHAQDMFLDELKNLYKPTNLRKTEYLKSVPYGAKEAVMENIQKDIQYVIDLLNDTLKDNGDFGCAISLKIKHLLDLVDKNGSRTEIEVLMNKLDENVQMFEYILFLFGKELGIRSLMFQSFYKID